MAATQNFVVVENDTWSFDVVYKDAAGVAINLAGYTARCQVRGGYDGPLKLSLTATIPNPADGTMKFAGFAALTQGDYVYDVEVEQGSPVTFRRTLLRGKLTVQPEVTQSA